MENEKVRKIVIQVLETSLELQLKAIRQIRGEEDEPFVIQRKKGKRHQSLVDLSIEILTETREPMHVNDIVKQLFETYARVTDRDSISSALGKKARQGILVRQIAKATFELLPEEENRH